MEISPEIIDLRAVRDEPLLDHLYQAVYLPNFHTPEQQEDPSIWKPLLWGPVPPPPKPILHILVAGQSLREPERRILFGFLILEFFRASACGLLTYLAVDLNARRRGVARLLLVKAIEQLKADARAQGTDLQAVFAEVNDPARVSESEGSTTPAERVKIFERLGARRVPVRYVQPQLKPGRGRSDTLLLMALPFVGISPYLLAPAAVLAHNEACLRMASDASKEAGSTTLRVLDRARRMMHQGLDRDPLPNIFHYPTERMIYTVGEESRGLRDQQLALRGKLSEIRSELQAISEKRRRMAEDVMGGLLLILSGFTLRDMLPLSIVLPVFSLGALAYVY